MPVVDEVLARIRTALPELRAEHGDVTIAVGSTYALGQPVRVRVRRRGRHYDITDDGTAVSLAGKRTGWLDHLEQVVANDGFNVNRRGVIFVPAFEGRDLAALVLRLGETSRRAYLTLLDL